MHWMPDSIGWAATAIFAVSYFFKGTKLRMIQAGASATWATYGVLIHSIPIIVANIIVVTLALLTAWREYRVGSLE